MSMSSDDPSKSKDSEPTEGEPTDALQFLSYTRSELKRKLDLKDEDDIVAQNFNLEQIVREIRAIIVVNDEIHHEIFSRCMVDTSKSNIHVIYMKRFEFKKIERRQNRRRLELVSHPEVQERMFDALPLTQLPSGLGDMVVTKYRDSPYSLFVDYDDYFRKALMLLNEDALGFVLPKLKDHLESVQVCFGEIHEWAMQPTNDLSFLGLTLQDVLSIPTKFHQDRCCFCGSRFFAAAGDGGCTEVRCGEKILLTSFGDSPKYLLTSDSERDRLIEFVNFMRG